MSLAGATTSIVVAIKVLCLSRQKIFCSYKHNFVVTNVLSRQAYFCCDKSCFLATTMILVAAPANDRVDVSYIFFVIYDNIACSIAVHIVYSLLLLHVLFMCDVPAFID